MAEHTTDQIQKVLYEKSDEQTKANVGAALKTLAAWTTRGPATCKVRIPAASGALVARDGVAFAKSVEQYTMPQDILNATRYVSLDVSLPTLIGILRDAMIAHALPQDRVVYVKNFINEVENLRTTADDLADRVQGLENNQ